MLLRLLSTTALLALTGTSPLSWADIYKYTDSKGRIILTDKPQHSGYKRLVKTWKGWEERNPALSASQMEANRKKFSKTIDYVAKEHRLPISLIHAVITAESHYNPDAVSKAGAVGLMQLMPATAKRYGVSNRANPHANIRGGSRYLKDLLTMFNNNLKLALAAYNAGENAVKKYGNKIPPYKETQNYVKKVLAYYQDYKSRFKSEWLL